jgi:2-polyprenyl-6-methoxyphenol hydroxylase-like FAD-dependent oxidoreductase
VYLAPYLNLSREIKPLGVGINLQPNAVREMYELGFGPEVLDTIGVKTQEFVLVGLNGNEVYSEWRGLKAGYKWPQYFVHRGGLQMLLYRAAIEHLGSDSIRTGMKVTGYRNHPDGKGVTALVKSRNGSVSEVEGALLIAADGLHSAVRQQMYPQQPPIQWGGAIMWRGVTKGKPIRTGASFVGLGTHRHRVVFYPISAPDPRTGLADINWIAEITVDNSGGWRDGDRNKQSQA